VKNELGSYLAEEGQPAGAANYFLAAIDLEPKEPLYHYQLATLLYEAREDFIKSGEYTRPQLDQAMHEGFRRAAELAPGNFAYAYRYAESFYDLLAPEWDNALQAWRALEQQATPGLGQQTIRLHEANVLIKQGQPGEARKLLDTVTDPILVKQKQKLVEALGKTIEK
jgi:predicted Zn-dependent protease